MPSARAIVLEQAQALGFGTVRFTTLQPTPHLDAYDAFLAKGYHGEMQWMVDGRAARAEPASRLAGARSVAVLAVAHHHDRPPDPGGRTGLVARYAWGRDYHNLVGKRLRKLRSALRQQGIATWGGVDTAPILERSWATAAGLGFTGKNCVSILPARTSWMFLAVLFLDADIEPDAPLLRDHCGACRRCLDACPTNAFPTARSLDATRCIAYWTIEARGLPPRELRAGFGRWVFGCDLCQEVCPHNSNPPPPDEDDLRPRNAWLDLDTVLQTPDAALEARFVGTPLRRPGAVGLKRNALIALANLGDDLGVPAARLGLCHPSPIVRGAAVWALHRLGQDLRDLSDPDPLVQGEVEACRSPSSTASTQTH